MSSLCLALTLLLAATGAESEPALRVEPAEVTLGQPFRLVLEVPVGAGEQASFPESLSIGEIRITGAEKASVAAGRARRSYEAACFRLGEHEIGPLSIEVKGGSAARKVELPKAKLKVVSVVAKGAAQVKDLRALAETQPNRRRDLWTAIAAAMVGLLMGDLLRYIRREKIRPVPPPVPAHVRALEALAALEKRKVETEAEVATFFVDVSGIVRRYIEDRFRLRAPELTTEEFLDVALRGPALVAEHRAELARFLERADLVKFARHRPESSACRDAIGEARAFVDATRERPVGAPAPSGALVEARA